MSGDISGVSKVVPFEEIQNNDENKSKSKSSSKSKSKPSRHHHRQHSSDEVAADYDDKDNDNSSDYKERKSSKRRDRDKKDKRKDDSKSNNDERRDNKHRSHRSRNDREEEEEYDDESDEKRRSKHRSRRNHRDKDKDVDKSSKHKNKKDKNGDLVLTEIDSNDGSSVEIVANHSQSNNQRQGKDSKPSHGNKPPHLNLSLVTETDDDEKEKKKVSTSDALLETDEEDDKRESSKAVMSPRSPRSGQFIGGKKVTQQPLSESGKIRRQQSDPVFNMFFRQVSKRDQYNDYLAGENDPILESMTEVLFKPYPLGLKLISGFIWVSQFLTLLSLLYSLLPCPSTRPSYVVVVAVPLCCFYSGIESIHHMLRYIHLGEGYRILVFLMIINSLLQLICVGVVMGKSEDLNSLISNFVGVAVVLQIDEFLAAYTRIKDVDVQLLNQKSWRTKMRLKSKIMLIMVTAFCAYAITLSVWSTDSMYCASYRIGNSVADASSSVSSEVTRRFR